MNARSEAGREPEGSDSGWASAASSAAGSSDRLAVQSAGSLPSRRRDCHFDDTPFLSLLKDLIKVEGGRGGEQNDSLDDG